MSKKDASVVTPEKKIKITLITDRDPSAGLPNTEVRVDDLSGVPGLLPHWTAEMNKRKKEILTVNNTSFAKKAGRFFGKSGGADTVTGAELLNIIDPNLKSNNSTKSLHANPTQCDERSHLVSYILKRSVKRGKEMSLLQMRALLIHAMLANAFEQRSMQSLLTMYQVYLAYIEQLLQYNENALKAMSKKQEGGNRMIYLNKNMVTVYKTFVGKRVQKILPQIKQLDLNNRDLKNFDKSQNNAEEKKNHIFRSAYYAVSIMRCFPLLQKETQEIAELVLKMDDSHPIGWFLRGHIIAASGELKFDQERGGYRPKGMKESMVEDIKTALENYGKAISAIKGTRYEGLDYNILAEYISFVVFVCRFIQAPRAWKVSNLEKAINTLKSAQSKNLPKLVKMQTNLETLLQNL